MPEEPASPDIQEEHANQTLAESGPETGTPAPDSQESTAPEQNWEQRFGDMQRIATQAQQEAAEYRQVVELARQGDPRALNYLGYEVPETDTEDVAEPDPNEKLSQLEERLNQQEQQAQEAARQQELQQAADAFYQEEFQKLDPENSWPQEYRNLVVAAGDQHIAEDGLPDLKAAHEAIQGQFESFFNDRVQRKRTPQAPPSGASPSHTPNLDNKDDRQNYMIEQMMENLPTS